MVKFEILVILLIIHYTYGEEKKGVVTLDELTFDKVVSRFRVALVKFAYAYPSGENHETFVRVAQSLSNVSDVILVNLEIKDYGPMDSYEIMQRYKVNVKQFPALRLFLDGNLENPIVFDDPESNTWEEIKLNADSIKIFLKYHAKIPVLLENCIQIMDRFAEKFIQLSITSERQKLYEEAKLQAEQILDKKEKIQAQVYLKLMEKGVERGNVYFESEAARVKALVAGRITPDKKKELQTRLNVLQSFIVLKEPPFVPKPLKDEL